VSIDVDDSRPDLHSAQREPEKTFGCNQIPVPADERNVLRRFPKVCLDNGLPKLRVYDLRHRHTSLLINEGVHPKRISERLGHSSIKLTMDTYGHLFAGSDRDSAEKMERLFGNVRAPDKKEPARNQSRIALASEHLWHGSVRAVWLTKTRKPASRGLVSDRFKTGATRRDRTGDLLITKQSADRK
jgi:hypothetical protein